jgi:hypothetical protein
VPAQNQQVEFNHNQEVQGDIIDLQEAVSRSGARGTSETVKIQTGTTYPSRLLFISPKSPSGSIRTQEELTVEIQNVQAEDRRIQQYIDGDITDLRTKRFVYSPSYNEYKNPPETNLEYGVLYNQFDTGENIVVNDGSVIRGNQITLTFLTGDLSKTQSGSTSVETLPTSAPARTVTVKPDGGPIRINLPTKLSPSEWESILSEELVSNGGNVQDITNTPDGVELKLRQSVQTYELRMSQIGIGSNAQSPDSEYMISPTGRFTTVKSGEPTDITFEVRDKYNNPVSGEDVTIGINPSAKGFLGTNPGTKKVTVTTDRQGRATVRYSSPSGVNTPVSLDIKGSYTRDPNGGSFSPSNNPEDVSVRVTIIGGVSGAAPSVDEFTLNEGQCVETDTGEGGTTVLGGEATNLSIDWKASISGSNNLDEVRIEMIDTSNGQTADSTRYRLNSQNADDTVILRDRRQNDDSCDKNYEVEIVVESDGGRTDSDDLTAESGSDYSDDPEPA